GRACRPLAWRSSPWQSQTASRRLPDHSYPSTCDCHHRRLSVYFSVAGGSSMPKPTRLGSAGTSSWAALLAHSSRSGSKPDGCGGQAGEGTVRTLLRREGLLPAEGTSADPKRQEAELACRPDVEVQAVPDHRHAIGARIERREAAPEDCWIGFAHAQLRREQQRLEVAAQSR